MNMPKRYVNTDVHENIIHNNQNMKTTHLSKTVNFDYELIGQENP